MNGDRPTDDLRDIVSQWINALVLEMQDADWRGEDVIDAVSAVISTEWRPRFRALDEARRATPENFVSDGNEG
jgi:hypothetical protein